MWRGKYSPLLPTMRWTIVCTSQADQAGELPDQMLRNFEI